MSDNGDARFRIVETGSFRDRIDEFVAAALDVLLCHAKRLLTSTLLVVTALALSGCAGPLSILEPAGPAARSIATLWWVMFLAGAAIFVLVMVLLVLAWRPRPQPAEQVGNERIWVGGLGLAFPIAILLSLLAYGLWLGEGLLPRDHPDVAGVQAEARRWSWTFSYEDAPGRTTDNVLHIPAGRPVDVSITTADVIHSFWVPRLAGKLDAIPGHLNVLRIQADAPGAYAGVSSEFSGPGYGGHAFIVIAHGPQEWQAFLDDSK